DNRVILNSDNAESGTAEVLVRAPLPVLLDDGGLRLRVDDDRLQRAGLRIVPPRGQPGQVLISQLAQVHQVAAEDPGTVLSRVGGIAKPTHPGHPASAARDRTPTPLARSGSQVSCWRAMRLSHDRYVEHIRSDAARIADVARRGLDNPVPSCPGWTVRDAVEHIAEVYRHKIASIREKAYPQPWPPERDDEPTLDYFQRATDDLLAELTTRDPLEYADTWWWDERTVGFWGRRMAHESAIHRVDVELAHADVTPIDHALALDGVDEVLRRFLAGDWSDEPVTARAP